MLYGSQEPAASQQAVFRSKWRSGWSTITDPQPGGQEQALTFYRLPEDLPAWRRCRGGPGRSHLVAHVLARQAVVGAACKGAALGQAVGKECVDGVKDGVRGLGGPSSNHRHERTLQSVAAAKAAA